jgi:hypothetical protein
VVEKITTESAEKHGEYNKTSVFLSVLCGKIEKNNENFNFMYRKFMQKSDGPWLFAIVG